MTILSDRFSASVLEHATDGEVCSTIPFAVPVLNPVAVGEARDVLAEVTA